MTSSLSGIFILLIVFGSSVEKHTFSFRSNYDGYIYPSWKEKGEDKYNYFSDAVVVGEDFMVLAGGVEQTKGLSGLFSHSICLNIAAGFENFVPNDIDVVAQKVNDAIDKSKLQLRLAALEGDMRDVATTLVYLKLQGRELFAGTVGNAGFSIFRYNYKENNRRGLIELINMSQEDMKDLYHPNRLTVDDMKLKVGHKYDVKMGDIVMAYSDGVSDVVPPSFITAVTNFLVVKMIDRKKEYGSLYELDYDYYYDLADFVEGYVQNLDELDLKLDDALYQRFVDRMETNKYISNNKNKITQINNDGVGIKKEEQVEEKDLHDFKPHKVQQEESKYKISQNQDNKGFYDNSSNKKDNYQPLKQNQNQKVEDKKPENNILKHQEKIPSYNKPSNFTDTFLDDGEAYLRRKKYRAKIQQGKIYDFDDTTTEKNKQLVKDDIDEDLKYDKSLTTVLVSDDKRAKNPTIQDLKSRNQFKDDFDEIEAENNAMFSELKENIKSFNPKGYIESTMNDIFGSEICNLLNPIQNMNTRKNLYNSNNFYDLTSLEEKQYAEEQKKSFDCFRKKEIEKKIMRQFKPQKWKCTDILDFVYPIYPTEKNYNGISDCILEVIPKLPDKIFSQDIAEVFNSRYFARNIALAVKYILKNPRVADKYFKLKSFLNIRASKIVFNDEMIAEIKDKFAAKEGDVSIAASAIKFENDLNHFVPNRDKIFEVNLAEHSERLSYLFKILNYRNQYDII